jgi:hypothetical protein
MDLQEPDEKGILRIIQFMQDKNRSAQNNRRRLPKAL